MPGNGIVGRPPALQHDSCDRYSIQRFRIFGVELVGGDVQSCALRRRGPVVARLRRLCRALQSHSPLRIMASVCPRGLAASARSAAASAATAWPALSSASASVASTSSSRRVTELRSARTCCGQGFRRRLHCRRTSGVPRERTTCERRCDLAVGLSTGAWIDLLGRDLEILQRAALAICVQLLSRAA